MVSQVTVQNFMQIGSLPCEIFVVPTFTVWEDYKDQNYIPLLPEISGNILETLLCQKRFSFSFLQNVILFEGLKGNPLTLTIG